MVRSFLPPDPGSGAPRLTLPLTAALLTAQVGQALTFVMLAAVLPQIAGYFGGGARGELVAQQMAVFPFLGLAAGGFLSGPVIRLLGLRRAVLFSSACYALAGSVPMLATAAAPMLAASFLLGLTASLLTSAISGVSAVVLASERLARLVSYQVALAIFTAAVLGFVSALAAERFGWRAPFAGYAATGAIIFLLNAFGLPDAEPPENRTGGAALTVRAAWPVYILAFLSFIVITLQPTFLPFRMLEEGIDSASTRSAMLTVSTGASFFGSMAYAQLQGRISPSMIRDLAIGLLVVAFAVFAAWDGSVAMMAIGMACAGFGGGLVIPMLFAAALARAPDAGAQSVGFLNVAIFAGSFLTPYLLALPRQAWGIPGMLAAVGACILSAGIALRLAGRRGAPSS